MQKVLKKGDLNDFISGLIKRYEVYAPVKKGNTKFDIIQSPEEIYLGDITEVPAKQMFIPEKEILLEFKKGKLKEIKDDKKRVIFGLRKCDLNAIKILDVVMHDSWYLEKRKNTILIGVHCENPDEYCFCNSMELEDSEKCSDLFFYPGKNEYNISVNSKKGLALVKNLKNSGNEVKLEINNKKILEKKDISSSYGNKIWETNSEKCLSCSACTVYCPTCNCFDLKDKLDINLKDGEKKRRGASCQLKSFSRVAGGKVFRESRNARFKHFVYHKIDYFKKRHGRYMCVGCGRCLRVCPTKIDWVNTINLLDLSKELKR